MERNSTRLRSTNNQIFEGIWWVATILCPIQAQLLMCLTFLLKMFWCLWQSFQIVEEKVYLLCSSSKMRIYKPLVIQDSPAYTLGKIQPVVDKLREAFRSAYCPSKNVSVDEAMILFKGLKHYLPLEPLKCQRNSNT